MESETIIMLTKLWPMFVAFILLIVTLAQSHYRIKVLEEKVKVVAADAKRWREVVARVRNPA